VVVGLPHVVILRAQNNGIAGRAGEIRDSFRMPAATESPPRSSPGSLNSRPLRVIV
jgi:hypothetical protein